MLEVFICRVDDGIDGTDSVDDFADVAAVQHRHHQRGLATCHVHRADSIALELSIGTRGERGFVEGTLGQDELVDGALQLVVDPVVPIGRQRCADLQIAHVLAEGLGFGLRTAQAGFSGCRSGGGGDEAERCRNVWLKKFGQAPCSASG